MTNQFTDLEIQMLEMFSNELNCDNFEDEIDNGNVCLLIESDLRDFPGGAKVARGVIASLVKKDMVYVDQGGDRTEYWATDECVKVLFDLF